MATPTILHVRLALPGNTAYEDTTDWSFTVQATGTNTGFANLTEVYAWLNGMLNTALTGMTVPLASYISNDVTRATNGLTGTVYDISSSLGGGPVGSPYSSGGLTLGAAHSGSYPLPQELACCVGYTATYGTVLERGGTVTLPSTDSAIDQGAPTTHTGVERPRARLRGRVFLGPFNDTTMATDHGEPISTFISDMLVWGEAVFNTQQSGTSNQFNPVVWSRRNANVNLVDQISVNPYWAIQRRRGDTTVNRVNTYHALSGNVV